MFLSKLPHGIYYLFFQDERGKRQKVTTRCRTKTDAYRFLQTFRADQRSADGRIRLAHFVGEFLAYARTAYAERTVLIYSNCLQRFLTFVGDRPLATFNAKHLDDYKAFRLGKVKPVTVNIEVRQIKAAFRTAVRWKMIHQSPFDQVKQCRVPEKPPVYISRADFERLLTIIKENWLRELILFAVLTGLRRGEIVNLKWSQIDLERRLISVQTDATFRTKSGKRRLVPMHDVVVGLLNQRIGRSHSEYVFTLNDQQIYDNWAAALFKRYVKKAKLDSQLHFHSLRDSFASWLALDGVSIYAISRLLGHSSVQTTQAYYAHLQPEQLHATVNRLSVSMN
jgi:integrase